MSKENNSVEDDLGNVVDINTKIQKPNKIKKIFYNIYNTSFKVALVAGVFDKVRDYYPETVKFIGEYISNNNLIGNTGLDDVVALGTSCLAVIGAYHIAEKYNPLKSVPPTIIGEGIGLFYPKSKIRKFFTPKDIYEKRINDSNMQSERVIKEEQSKLIPL